MMTDRSKAATPTFAIGRPHGRGITAEDGDERFGGNR